MPKRPKTFTAANLDGRLVSYRRGRGPGRAIERQVNPKGATPGAWAAINTGSMNATLDNFSASELRAIAAAWESES